MRTASLLRLVAQRCATTSPLTRRALTTTSTHRFIHHRYILMIHPHKEPTTDHAELMRLLLLPHPFSPLCISLSDKQMWEVRECEFGKGVFATEYIPPLTYIGTYVGTQISREQYKAKKQKLSCYNDYCAEVHRPPRTPP